MSNNMSMGIHGIIMKVALSLFVISFIVVSVTNYNVVLTKRAVDNYDGSDTIQLQSLQDTYKNSQDLNENVTFFMSLVYLVSLLLFMFSSISVATNEDLSDHVRLGLLFISGTGIIFLGFMAFWNSLF